MDLGCKNDDPEESEEGSAMAGTPFLVFDLLW